MSILDTFWNHSVEQLEKALDLRKQISALQENLSALFGGHALPSSTKKKNSSSPKARKGKRGMSAEGRARIAAAQKARWAKSKGTEAKETVAEAPAKKGRKKGGMSAEGRARIVAAQKARWAKAKAGKAPAAPAKAKAGRKKKRNLSPEARERIVAAVRARWAKQKAKR
ncbi:MAG TPA: hypothetical protein VGM54_25745 [Chthoniobacter sp.]|jgi:hypothetical protein